jgi:hypothetical protein
MAYNNGIISAPVSIYDVQMALGTNECDLATLCGHSNINPMAKYKPVRFNTVITMLTNEQRRSVRYGINNSIPHFATSNKNPNVTWAYDAVRAGTDWARLTDFENYYHGACVPFAFDLTGSIKDGVGIQLFANSSAGNYYQEQGSSNRWDSDRNLSLGDLLTNVVGFDPTTMRIGFAIHDLDDVNGYYQVVITSTVLANIASTVPYLTLYPTSRTESGVTYPAVSMLNDVGRNGHTFRFIAFIVQNSSAASGSYVVLPDNQKAIDVYSLAIMDGIDRKDLLIYNHFTIFGLTFSISSTSISKVDNGIVTNSYGLQFHWYTLSFTVSGVFKTPSTWPFTGSSQEGTPHCIVTISANGYLDSCEQPSSSHTYDKTLTYVNSPGHTFTDNQLAVVSSVNVYIFSGAENGITISARVHRDIGDENVYSDNTISTSF